MGAARLLCVDDDELGLMVRRMMLEEAGFEVATATDGPRGLDLLKAGTFDLVLLDHAMPGMNGGEVAREIRLHWPQLPIMLLSAYVTLPEEDVRLVDAYVTKGESTEVLLETVGRLLKKRKGADA